MGDVGEGTGTEENLTSQALGISFNAIESTDSPGFDTSVFRKNSQTPPGVTLALKKEEWQSIRKAGTSSYLRMMGTPTEHLNEEIYLLTWKASDDEGGMRKQGRRTLVEDLWRSYMMMRKIKQGGR